MFRYDIKFTSEQGEKTLEDVNIELDETQIIRALQAGKSVAEMRIHPHTLRIYSSRCRETRPTRIVEVLG